MEDITSEALWTEMAVEEDPDLEQEQVEGVPVPAMLQSIIAEERSDEEMEEEDSNQDASPNALHKAPAPAEPVTSDDSVLPASVYKSMHKEDEAAPLSRQEVISDVVPPTRKRSSRKRGRGKKNIIPPDVARMLGEANMCYVAQDFPKAITLLEKVIHRFPRASEPYHTLGLVYEEMGDDKRALESYLVAAYLTNKDAETWKRVATMSHEQGLLEQAHYCINRALRLASGDVDAQYARAKILLDLGQKKKGVSVLLSLAKQRPSDANVATEVARLYADSGKTQKAIDILQECLRNNINQGGTVTRPTDKIGVSNTSEMDIGSANSLHEQLHISNILAELLMSEGKFVETIGIIDGLERRSMDDQGHSLPIDLAVKCGICHAHTSNMQKADVHLQRLASEDVKIYPDLYFDAAEALLALDLHGTFPQ